MGRPAERMFDNEGLGLVEPRFVRGAATVAVLGVALLAAISDPGPPGDVALAAAAAAVFVGWVWWPVLPTPVLAVLVLGPVVLAARSGQLEQALFLASLLALLVAWLEPSTPRAAVVGVLALLSPAAVWLLLPPRESFGVWSWVLGITFPWLLGRLVRRQLELITRLEAVRGDLAAQVVTEERRRIARDVHDLVGHGLAAVLLQITSARHVLRRDLGAADEALAAAETAGRRSMAELRTTMALLRSDGDAPGSAGTPSPGLGGLAGLVDAARADGLRVTFRADGDLTHVDDGVALAVHRILQESLANAHRHAPRAATTVAVAVDGDAITLAVTSTGPVHPRADDDRPRYGLVGMRERAEVVGGELQAGPDPQGWHVRGRFPVTGPS
ncbi:sensor histidine kinase [Pseudonocardia sp. GCM10023141]|uniref:sensor histidine kinase n=1 Tax=Pseudonocardia sp. GCM10023141 TaxID=3252653 RepID=UPI003610857E